MGSKTRRIVSKIQILADRDWPRCIVYGLEIRITSFVGQSVLLAVGDSVDRYPDPAPDERSFKDGRRITLNEVSEETGISRPTSTRISNVPGYNTNTGTISALCDYFEIESGELLKKV